MPKTKSRRTRRPSSAVEKRQRALKESAALDSDGPFKRRAIGGAVQDLIKRKGLSRDDAAVVVKDAASQMSRLMTGHLAEFAADRLGKMFLRLGGSVDIVLRMPKNGSRAQGKSSIRVVG